VDNDHSFVPPFIREKGKSKLQIKSIIFCLDLMQRPLHPELVELIRKQNPKEEIENWLQGLKVHDAWMKKKFPEKNSKCLLEVIFPPGYIGTLLQKWTILVGLMNTSPDLRCIDILGKCTPGAGLLYKQLFKISSIYERYHQVSEGIFFSQSATRTILAVEMKKPLDLTGALDELHLASIEYQKREDVLAQVRKGYFSSFNEFFLDVNKEFVIRKLDWQCLSENDQRTLLSSLDSISFTRLHLHNCTLITYQHLYKILQISLSIKSIVLDNIPNVTDYFWSLLYGCNTLTKMSVRNAPLMEFLQLVSYWLMPSTLPLENLQSFHLEDCPKLRAIHLDAPQLRKLVLRNLPMLTGCRLEKSPNLETLEIRACDSLLSSSSVDTLRTKNGIDLKIEDCKLLKRVQDSWDHFVQGQSLFEQKEYEAAMRQADEALELNPRNYFALFLRGASKCSIGRYHDAFQDYEEAAKINPEFVDPYNNLKKLNLMRHPDFIKGEISWSLI
jgi:tetratricopeptide (TPR) repeat protein